MTGAQTFGQVARNWQVCADFAVPDEVGAAEILGAAVADMQARADSVALRPVLIVEDETQRYYHPSAGRAVPEPLTGADGGGR